MAVIVEASLNQTLARIAEQMTDGHVLVGPIVSIPPEHYSTGFVCLFMTGNGAVFHSFYVFDEPSRVRIVREIARGKLDIHVFDDEREMLAMASQLWPSDQKIAKAWKEVRQ